MMWEAELKFGRLHQVPKTGQITQSCFVEDWPRDTRGGKPQRKKPFKIFNILQQDVGKLQRQRERERQGVVSDGFQYLDML